MNKIKFGTDGWRAIIAKDFTVENVERVTCAVADWLLNSNEKPTVVLGHDCRFGGELFARTAAKILASRGIQVHLANGFVSTPMISLGTVNYKASLGIIITASHNPPSYNGYKLKGHYGGPLLPSNVEEIEKLIPEKSPVSSDDIDMAELLSKRLIQAVDLETMYCEHVQANFDLAAIAKSNLNLAYDAMFGAGQNVMRRLLPDITFMHCDYNPSFEGTPPEPILKNLRPFSEFISLSGNIDCGLVTDGDADRLGLFDHEGKFIDSHHIILLLIHYMVKYRGMSGKVVTAFSTTPRVAKLCAHYGLELEVVKIGFKYICEIMLKEDVLLGGEESGGIAVKGHIPERDGIWTGLVIWEYMAKSGKSLYELIEEVYEITGPFHFERSDLSLPETVKNNIVKNCKEGKYSSFGKYKVDHVEDLDGWKYFFENGDWLMIRASGTEAVLRTYAESSTKAEALDILKDGRETLLMN